MQQTPIPISSDAEYLSHRLLRFKLLGNYAVAFDTTPEIRLHGRKEAALLFYLVMSKTAVRRITLATMFWPEKDLSVAKNNLRTTLASLKKSFSTFLTIGRTAVSFNHTAPHVVDVEILYEKLNSGLAMKNIEQLQQAIDLYEGELLQGLQLRNAEPFDDWLLQQRGQLHLQIVRALETIIAFYTEQKAYREGLAASHRLLQIEPWSETAHEHLMRLLAITGQREHALQQYESYRQILEGEIGVEPSTEMKELYHQIQSGTITNTGQTLADTSISTTQFVRTDEKTLSLQMAPLQQLPPRPIHFDTHQIELAYLVQCLRSANCRLLTIVGPGHIGKTTLAITAAHQFMESDQKEFPDGVIFVSLIEGKRFAQFYTDNRVKGDYSELINASIASQMIFAAIADQFHLMNVNHTDAVDTSTVTNRLQEYLHNKQLLLILDGFEHLMAGANQLVALLTLMPKVKMLITSRFALRVRGETLLPLKTTFAHQQKV